MPQKVRGQTYIPYTSYFIRRDHTLIRSSFIRSCLLRVRIRSGVLTTWKLCLVSVSDVRYFGTRADDTTIWTIVSYFLQWENIMFTRILLFVDRRQFLSATKREILADYALPIAVIAFTLIGSWAFTNIDCKYLVNVMYQYLTFMVHFWGTGAVCLSAWRPVKGERGWLWLSQCSGLLIRKYRNRLTLIWCTLTKQLKTP